MTDDRERHFASDEETLSGYVLGRLDRAERERVDRHAAECGMCMESLRREMRIAAGARRLGREDLKSRLQRKIEAGTRPERWPRVLGAAAVLAIAAGLGVYYAWFRGAESLTSGAGGTPPLAAESESLKRDDRNAPVKGPADRMSAAKAAESPAPAGAQGEEHQKFQAPPARRSAEELRKTEPAPRASLAASETARGAVTGEQAGEFWSEGIVERAAGATAAEPGGAQEKNELLFKSKGAKEEGRKDARLGTQGEYSIRQLPAGALEGNRGTPGGEQRRIPTRVDQRGGTTTMTLYLDSLLDEADLKKARVEAVSDDSLVVTLGGKKILYRFPPGQMSQQKQK